MLIFENKKPDEIKSLMRLMGVDPYGIKLMLPKVSAYSILLKDLPNIAANILKQEMLALGADAAVARGALSGKTLRTDCLLIGQLSQFNDLTLKLKKQPFGLNKLGEALKLNLNNYQKNNFILKLGNHKFNLAKRTHIMGIINLTPDSFSGDGLYKSQVTSHKSQVVIEYAKKLIEDGADIIDIGGESSRPGAKPVSAKEEMARVVPVLKFLIKKVKVPVSIDTRKPEVAKAALDLGAVLINDISGMRDGKMVKLAAKYQAAVVIMHMRKTPQSMQKGVVYDALILEIIEYLDSAVKRLQDAGVDPQKIICDPGIGFGKLLKHNLEILNRLEEFKILGKPLLIGTSRKSFIGKILDSDMNERVSGTIASNVVAVMRGAQIVRVHDVKEVAQAIKLTDAIKHAKYLA